MTEPLGTVRVEGIAALARTFGRMDRALRKQMAERLAVLARTVAATAQQHAARQGFSAPGTSGRGTGRLEGSIRGSVRRGYQALIRDTARNRKTGYAYPRRYEYESDGARAFMRPALEEDRELIVRELEEMVGGVLTIT